jgi:hypothetical protein
MKLTREVTFGSFTQTEAVYDGTFRTFEASTSWRLMGSNPF